MKNFNTLNTGIALKCIVSQYEGCDRESFLLASLVGCLISQFCPWAPKALGGPVDKARFGGTTYSQRVMHGAPELLDSIL